MPTLWHENMSRHDTNHVWMTELLPCLDRCQNMVAVLLRSTSESSCEHQALLTWSVICTIYYYLPLFQRCILCLPLSATFHHEPISIGLHNSNHLYYFNLYSTNPRITPLHSSSALNQGDLLVGRLSTLHKTQPDSNARFITSKSISTLTYNTENNVNQAGSIFRICPWVGLHHIHTTICLQLLTMLQGSRMGYQKEIPSWSSSSCG